MKDIQEAFAYQFKDPNIVSKFIIGSLIALSSMFLIPMPFMVGYLVRNIRNIINKEKSPLPEWSDWGKMYVEGLKFILASLVYALPAVIVIILGATIMMIGLLVFENEDAAIIFVIPYLLAQVFTMLYTLVLSLVTPVLYIKVAQGAKAKELYNVKEIFKFVKLNFVNILISFLVLMACGFVMNVGMLFLFIGIFPAMYYCSTVTGYVYAQIKLQEKK
ncbi:MAG: DUF4013 domain-containing protein [Patescibacteria group bacterium]|jgi:hypothetical protein